MADADGPELSGRELLQAMCEGRVPYAPMLQTMAITLVEVGDGRVVCEGRPGPQHLHPGGVVHGGFALTMIDNAAGGAANTLRPAGARIGTIETKANLVRAITPDSGPVRATGQVLSAGRRIIVAEARLTDVEDQRLAHGTSTLMLSAEV